MQNYIHCYLATGIYDDGSGGVGRTYCRNTRADLDAAIAGAGPGTYTISFNDEVWLLCNKAYIVELVEECFNSTLVVPGQGIFHVGGSPNGEWNTKNPNFANLEQQCASGKGEPTFGGGSSDLSGAKLLLQILVSWQTEADALKNKRDLQSQRLRAELLFLINQVTTQKMTLTDAINNLDAFLFG